MTLRVANGVVERDAVELIMTSFRRLMMPRSSVQVPILRAWIANFWHRLLKIRFRCASPPFGQMLFARFVGYEWRLSRVPQIEASLFRYEVLDHEARQARRVVDKYVRTSPDGVLTITDKSRHTAAVEHVERVALRDGEILAIAFIGAAGRRDALAKLSRYETSLERSRDKTLAKLERLQAAQGRGPTIRRRGLDAWGVLGRSAKRS